jgi:hypothetical protein
MKKILKYFLFAVLGLVLLFAGYFSIGSAPRDEKITWGVNFSQTQAQWLGLDWKAAYLALLEDLGVKNIKLITYWNLLEGEKGKYNFEDLDWQIAKADEHGVKLLLAIGMRTPRWPECHIPDWAKSLSKEEQQERILGLLETIITRYGGFASVWAWQVENEPFFPFGECPKGVLNEDFLKKEIDLVKSLDGQNRPVVISDSGEFSSWFSAARLGDIVGTTLHRKAWFEEIGSYVTYPIRPIFYWRKAQIISRLFGKPVIVGELQAEPWCYKYFSNECDEVMNLQDLKNNIEFAQETGLGKFYLWGAEWWYWMKEKQNKPEIWNEAKKLFNEVLY